MPSYEEVLRCLDDGLAVAAQLGLADVVKGSRFTQYRKDLEQLIEVVRLGREGRRPPELVRAVLEHHAQYVAALSESHQFGDALGILADTAPVVLKRKVRAVLAGPPLPSDEDANSNQARNILFELTLAARLKRAGLRPLLGDRPDVVCTVDGSRLAFECKRVFSEKKLADRTAEAGDSLHSDLEAATSGERGAGVGVIAISAAKLFSRSQVPSSITSEPAARGFLNGWLEALAASTRHAWAPQIEGGPVIGIMFHAFGIFENEDVGRYDLGEWWIGVYERDADVFLKLGEALKATSY